MAGVVEQEQVGEFGENIQTDNVEIETTSQDKSDKLIKLPLSRIKHIIKQDPDVNLASHDAVVMIAKATELFIGEISSASYNYTAKLGRKTVQKKDVETAVEKSHTMAFLDGTLEG